MGFIIPQRKPLFLCTKSFFNSRLVSTNHSRLLVLECAQGARSRSINLDHRKSVKLLLSFNGQSAGQSGAPALFCFQGVLKLKVTINHHNGK